MLLVDNSESGFSLIELIIALTIVAILALLASKLPQSIVQQSETQIAGNSIANMLRLSRNLAISASTNVIMCPSIDDSTCINEWNKQLIVFIDENRNSLRDTTENIIFRHSASKRSQISYTRARSFLRFNASGSINNNGSFYICPNTGDSSMAIALIINRQGRLRYGEDTDNDGIIEGTGANNISCN